jgi:hypothetical protein
MLPTVVLALAELFAVFDSEVAVLTVAVFVIVPVAPVFTFTTIENVALAPLTSVAMLHVVVPVPPPGGVEHVNAGPAV